MRIARLALAMMAWAVLYQPSFGQYVYPGYGYNGYPAYPQAMPPMPVPQPMGYPNYPYPYPPGNGWYAQPQAQPIYPTYGPVMVPAPPLPGPPAQVYFQPQVAVPVQPQVRWANVQAAVAPPSCAAPPVYVPPLGGPCLPQQPPTAPAPTPAPTPQQGTQPSQPSAQQPSTTPAPEAAPTTPEADLDTARSGAGLGETFAANPAMFGDQVGPSINRVIRLANGATAMAHIPFAARGAFKIAENESPRPTDRVFFNYNYFNSLAIASQSSGALVTADLHRETIGFEKTFLEGNASFGMRLPFLQLEGDGSVSEHDIGDITFILKYAMINDRQTGNVLSGGLAVTAPTGPDNIPNVGNLGIHPTLLQPYVGYILNKNNLYFHGFTSIVAPTDKRDVTLLFNDIGVGYWLRRNRNASFIRGIVPTFEAHVTTPLNHRGLNSVPVGASDEVEITQGVHILMPYGADLGTAIGETLTGPRPYAVEAFANLTFRF